MDNRFQVTVELISARLASGGQVRLTVNGNSMAPFLRHGNAVWAEPASPADLRQGDLVVLRRQGELVTHRLVGVGDHGWLTKGDNASRPDPPVAEDAILGRVVAVERAGVRVELRGRRWLIVNRLLGMLGWWEACAVQMGRRMKHRLIRGRHWPVMATLARLAAVPRRVIMWFLTRWRFG